MSSYADINLVSCNIAALSNDCRPLFKVPAGFGGITVVSGNITSFGAGTSSVNVVNMGTAGTSASSTIATLGSVVFVAGTPQAFTVSTAYVDEGDWVGIEEVNVGALNAVTIVDVGYVMGR
jgi:hypothetical protein